MSNFKKWAGRASVLTAVTAMGALALPGASFADNIQDSITGTGSVSLVAGSGVSGSASILLIANNAGSTQGGDPIQGCNVTLGSPLVLTINTPAGVTANPSQVTISDCGADKGASVSFTASATAVSADVTVTYVSGPGGADAYKNQVDIPITVTQPTPPANTKPSVVVTGFTSGDTFEIGSEPTPGCSVTDAEDTNPVGLLTVDRSALSHGLGTVTVTCDYTDTGGLVADTATATYTIVDTGDPTISHTLNPADANANGWYNEDVTVTFNCDDIGSGIQSCYTGTDPESDSFVTLGEGADQSVTGTATDWAGNSATDTVSGINIDETDPTVSFVGGPSDGVSYYFGDVPAPPTCDASDALSGVDGTCSVDSSAGGTSVGDHSYKATVTDKAGNTASVTVNYTVLAWTIKGFYQPVDMTIDPANPVWNTVKGGSTVPLKFEIFAGSTEKTDISAVSGFSAKPVTCPNGTPTTDAIEFTLTGGTSLRYDSTAGQFVQNWATPKKPGACYVTTMTARDGSTISANFMLK
ncbi:MAG TPA: PxKF domain-containing protein [Nocardioides sp.]|uniref:PxKF domain-containing protein n=1 Tax=Nocardioides sp. TaxID=35761 RepID=UPI002F40D419